MTPLSPATAVVAIGTYGSATLARIWADSAIRPQLEAKEIRRWIFNEFSLPDLYTNAALSRANLDGAEFEINVTPEPFGIPARSHVIAALGGKGGRRLREMANAGELADCHLHVILPFSFDSGWLPALEDLESLRSWVSDKTDPARRLSIVNCSDYCEGKVSMNEALKKVQLALQETLLRERPGT
ncbi:MAG: hypothetical protein K0Q68_319 [Moraxellaceae bacterium]|jgi:hypothetical protein|nr:hypothetical protein [Moraxellaceae bacterium]